MYGQLLDLQTTGRLSDDVETALHIIRYKTAKYTIERPLHIGAALVSATAPVLEACTAFGIPLGEAFQLRDDLLGVFGDSVDTGKSVLDDLRAGKGTVLMALAVQRASPAELSTLRSLVGRSDLNEDQAHEVRTVLDSTGARESVEEMIAVRRTTALAALDEAPFPGVTTASLQPACRRCDHTPGIRAAPPIPMHPDHQEDITPMSNAPMRHDLSRTGR